MKTLHIIWIMAKAIGSALAVTVIYSTLREVSLITAGLFIVPVLGLGILMCIRAWKDNNKPKQSKEDADYEAFLRKDGSYES